MKAIRMVAVNQPLELQEIPEPSVGDGDILVRVKAAGICHSDVHYRAGKSPVDPLPLTLGHEIAGVVEKKGRRVTKLQEGDRVCLHYLISCGHCYHCSTGNEQFCRQGSMLGHFSDGGYAEYIAVPERNAVRLPADIPFTHGAVLMCSSATSLHALRKARLRGGETVAVFGIGGLGMSAIQLAYALGALEVYAVDINTEKLKLAERYGAIPIHAAENDPVAQIRHHTRTRGVDVALELIGLTQTIQQAVGSLSFLGRAVVAGICSQSVPIDTYRELIGKEAEVIGSNDHLLQELPLLLQLVTSGKLDLTEVVSRTVSLDASAVNDVLDNLEHFGGDIRTVIVP